MDLNEAKELLVSEGYLLEDKSASDYKTFKDYLKDFKAELLTQYMSPEIGERKYKAIIVNKTLFKFIKDNWANGDYSPAEMVEYILDNDLDESYQVDWNEPLDEARKPKIKLIFGIRKREPGAKCKPAFATFEEADAYMDKFTYPQDFEIVNLLQHPELLEEDFTMGVGAPLGADQGIPHSMQGCAVPMMRLGEPAPYGKIQKCGPPHPMHRHRPIPFGLYLLGSNVNLLTYGKKRKRKKKKRKKK